MERYLVNASSLNLRAGPKVADNIIGSLERGAVVEQLEASGDGRWVKVQRGGARPGWVFAKYLTRASSESSAIVKPEEFPWMPIALSEMGQREAPGPASNPRVVEYLRSTELDAVSAAKDSTAWCSGFVNWCVEKSGYAGSNSAWARSWLHWGKSVSRPRRGCIAVFSRGAGGHVAFYLGARAEEYRVLGGNQSDAVCVAGYAKSRLLGFRVPA